MRKDTVEIEGVVCTGETDKAIFVDIEGEEHCIPKSQVDQDSEVYKKGTDGRLVISRWIAEKKGLV